MKEHPLFCFECECGRPVSGRIKTTFDEERREYSVELTCYVKVGRGEFATYKSSLIVHEAELNAVISPPPLIVNASGVHTCAQNNRASSRV